jgi:hypothetical protein
VNWVRSLPNPIGKCTLKGGGMALKHEHRSSAGQLSDTLQQIFVFRAYRSLLSPPVSKSGP